MELIIKPTERCNFKCTFCSSPHLSEENSNILNLNYIFDFLKKYPETNTIIVNGGDPLMVEPKYYWDLLEYINKKKLPCNLALTSNLWDFYKKPEKWIELFNNEKVQLTTSFNYGDTRKINNNRVYTEKDFWEVSNLFLEKVGYRPDFISVINNENLNTAIDNVYLAKK
jgi:MoaA/NifB/PqqE/SkfB family radical SAM enzyme